MKIDEKELFKRVMTDFILEEDPMLAMLKWMTEKLMEAEAANKVGANKNEHSSSRTTHFSGYRPRRFDTRMGTMYLMVPKLRKGGYIPFFITEKKRAEQALISVVQEAYINGVSTRKIERIAKEMGIDGISASQVSQINKGLNEQVEAFRSRVLQKEYPFIWVDALYEKIRSNGRVISTAIMIAYGVGMDGKREVLAIEPFYSESNESWRAFFKKLKARGLQKCALVVSDAHQGIQNAVKNELTGCSWQRCKVHFMRNILAWTLHGITRLHRNIPTQIMDSMINKAIQHIAATHDIEQIIHGHIHRQQVDEFVVNNKKIRRICNSDWDKNKFSILCYFPNHSIEFWNKLDTDTNT